MSTTFKGLAQTVVRRYSRRQTAATAAGLCARPPMMQRRGGGAPAIGLAQQIRSIQEWQKKGSTVTPPSSRENPAIGIAPSREDHIGNRRFADFDLEGRVCIVTGGARGLGLALAEGLVEAGANGT